MVNEEGRILNNILYRKFARENKNFLGVVVGGTGSGKSWFCLTACEIWYKRYFNEEYPIENVGWNPSDIMNRIVNGNLREGEILILEEGGTSMSSLEFQNKIAKLFNYILQSFRSKNIGLIINLPNFSMLNKQTRMLMHMLFQTNNIDRANERIILVPYHLQYNQQTGKLYRHKPRVMIEGVMEKIHFISYPKPSDNLIKAYEKRKLSFVDGLSREVLDDMQEYMQKRKALSEIELLILDCWERGVFRQQDIANIISRHQVQVSKSESAMRKKGYLKEEWRKKAQINGK
jgi:ABC-type dipeptide/oligopeptide/nickel transport system ATPase component